VDLERPAIVAALRSQGGNIGKAARQLGCSRRTLQNRMREFGLPRGRAGRRRRVLPYRSRTAALGVAGAAVGVLGLIALTRKRNA